MMFFFINTSFINKAYGADMKETWFGGDKPGLIEKNACMNLPYVINGEEVVTQSNSVLLYLGQKLGIDTPENFVHNHQVLDQTMDLRNDLMKIVYPFGAVKTKEEFPAAAKSHMEGSATGNFTKLEGFCKGPYMCGDAPQSGDFHVFEMLDQHKIICEALGIEDVTAAFPKLTALHAAMKAHPNLAAYFAHEVYTAYPHNNGLLTHFTGQGEDFVYGASSLDDIKL
jgi:glutathione S-transferase